MKTDPKTSTQLKSDPVRPVANLLAILLAFGTNVYSNLAPPSGLSIGDISNRFFSDVLIIPANYAFAIWGIIYLGLISFGVYQVLPEQRDNINLRRGSYLLVLASLAQIVWVFLFQYQLFALSVVAMLVILGSLIGYYLRLGIGTVRRSKSYQWLVEIPISIYLGWISVATIVNIASTLDYWGWNGWGISPTVWTVIMLGVAAGIGAIVTLQRRDIAYPLVIIWAFVAIALRHSNIISITVTAVALAIALAILIFQKLRQPYPQ